MRHLRSNKSSNAGFSLIEVVITVAILSMLTVAVASTMRNSFDVRQGLSDKGKAVHRLAVSLDKIASDLQHAFIVSSKDLDRNGNERSQKTIFQLGKSGLHGDKLLFTTMNHHPRVVGAYESDFTLVSYQLKESKEAAGRLNLYRGETPVIPLDIKEEQPSKILAKGIKSLVFECWTGDRWSKDAWDSTQSETHNRIPRMVRITIEGYQHDREDGDGQDEATADQLTDSMSTVVTLERAIDFSELKEPDQNLHWSGL